MWFPLLAGIALATSPSAEDLVSLAWVGGLQVSPDGKSAIFRHSKQSRDGTDEDAWSREAQLWWIDLASGETRVLTQGDNRPWGAAWSPDGSAVAFLRSGDEGSVLNLLSMDGGEPRTVALPHHIGQWAWDGPDAIVYSATPEADEDEDEDAWRVGGAWAFDQEWDNARVYAMALDAEEAEALTPEDLHIADWEWDANHRRLLATVADVMPLIGPNRALVAHGLRSLGQSAFPGILELLRASGVRGTPTASDLGFRLGPRLNGAGRMGRTEAAFRLLATSRAAEARGLFR